MRIDYFIAPGHPSHFSVFFLIGLLCIGVTMYMLGTTFTMWSLQDSSDPFTGSVLEGFSLPSRGDDFSTSHFAGFVLASVSLGHGILLDHSLFHPPDSRV